MGSCSSNISLSGGWIFALLLFIGSITIGYMVGNITARMLIKLVRWLGRLITEPEDELIDE